MKPSLFHFKILAVLIHCLFFICLAVFGFAQEEKILNYDTEIEVFEDRSITVTEFIEVQVMGIVIKRGITRSLPGSRNLNGNKVSMKYKILEVEKDGQPEPYHVSSEYGKTLYLGQEDIFLKPGVYKYKIKYKVPNQVGFFDEYDEIYWNAIGTDVSFQIENASCQLRFPGGAKLVQETAYVGGYGYQGKEYTVDRKGATLNYRTTRKLMPGEGLTVAAGIEKGIITPPSFLGRFGTLILILLASIFLLPYYLFTWWKHGQDPPTPASYPIWISPNGLSPASINYIQNGRNSNKGFTSSIINLAIHGFLKIEETVEKGLIFKSRKFELIKVKDPDSQLADEEKKIMEKLFRSANKVDITGTYDYEIENTFNGHNGSLTSQHKKFIKAGNNAKFLIRPILITVAVFIAGIIILALSPYASSANLTSILAFTPIAIGSIILYAYLIKQPSKEKLELRSRIKGFEMYLELTEKDRLELLNPPDLSPEHFEALLPFAFALGVEHKWTDRFKDILEKAKYQPQWHNSASPVYFSNHFGSDFSRSVSSASTKPSDSSSGSSGGGFSGGGGGGGGVGGW